MMAQHATYCIELKSRKNLKPITTWLSDIGRTFKVLLNFVYLGTIVSEGGDTELDAI